jgi:hypothetical protein
MDRFPHVAQVRGQDVGLAHAQKAVWTSKPTGGQRPLGVEGWWMSTLRRALISIPTWDCPHPIDWDMTQAYSMEGISQVQGSPADPTAVLCPALFVLGVQASL